LVFRYRWLKPPHGWRTVSWELVVVVVGVLIALAAQQWAEDRSWQRKAGAATEALRAEVTDQFRYAAEWRVVEHCVLAQIDRLQQRLLASGARLDPAPVHSEPGFAFYVIRMPNRNYEESVWRASVTDGVNTHLAPNVRRGLNRAYTANGRLAALNDQNNTAYQRLLSLARPIPLDPTVRFSLLQDLEALRGRAELMSHLSGQSIANWSEAGMIPAPEVARQALDRSGTYRFCQAQRLPVRPLAEAVRPIAYQ
jgi:type II secretory pathway pseudopilin PulG